MTAPRSATERRVHLALLYAGGTLLVVALAYLYMFSRFAEYDDEGWLMLTVRQVQSGRTLYDELAVPYGPVYYAWRLLVHALFPLTHDVVRLVSVASWIVASALFAWAAWLLTPRGLGAAAAVTTLVLCGSKLRVLANEPGHPQEIVVVLVAATLVVAARAWEHRRLFAAGALGVFVALLVATKLNVGVFLGLAVGLAIVLDLRAGLVRRVLVPLAVIPVLVLPTLLVQRRLPDAWALDLTLAVTTGLAISVFLCLRSRGDSEPRVLVTFAGAALVVLALSVGFAMSLGSTVGGLVDSLFSKSLRYTSDLGWGLETNVQTILWPAGSLVFFALYLVGRRHFGRAGSELVPLMKLALGVMILYSAQRHPAAPIKYALPWIWVLLVPEVTFVRALAAFVPALQVLQVFPIPGSQIAIGTVSLLPLAAVNLAEGFEGLALPGGEQATRRLARTGMALLAMLALGLTAWRTWSAGERYFSNEPVTFPGCRLLRMAPKQAATFTWLTDTLRASDATFVGVGGMNSLYFWAGLEPRTTDLTSHSWELFEQEHFVESYRDAPRLAVVEWSRFLQDHERTGPWFAFVDAELVRLGRFGRHTLFGREGELTLRSCALPVSTGELSLFCESPEAVTYAGALDLADGRQVPLTFDAAGDGELRLHLAASIEGFELPAIRLLRGERRSTLPVLGD